MSEDWNNGLCREFTKSFLGIIKQHQYSKNDFNFSQVGYEAVALYREMFDHDES